MSLSNYKQTKINGCYETFLFNVHIRVISPNHRHHIKNRLINGTYCLPALLVWLVLLVAATKMPLKEAVLVAGKYQKLEQSTFLRYLWSKLILFYLTPILPQTLFQTMRVNSNRIVVRCFKSKGKWLKVYKRPPLICIQKGAKTFSMLTHNITTFSIMDLTVNFSIITLGISMTCHYAECRNSKCHFIHCNAECHYAEWCYAACHYAECHGTPRIVTKSNRFNLTVRCYNSQTI